MALSGAHDLPQHMERRLRQRSACGARFRGCAATRRVLPRLCAVCRRGATETWARGGRGSSSQRRRTHVAPSASNALDDQTAIGRVAIVLDRHLAAHQVMMSAVRHAAGVGSARVSEGVERRARKEGEGGRKVFSALAKALTPEKPGIYCQTSEGQISAVLKPFSTIFAAFF